MACGDRNEQLDFLMMQSHGLEVYRLCPMGELTRAHWVTIDCIDVYGSLVLADRELKLGHHALVYEVPHCPRVNQCCKSKDRL